MLGYCETIEVGPRFVAVAGWLRRAAFGGAAQLVVRGADGGEARGPLGKPVPRDDLAALDAAMFDQVLRVAALPVAPVQVLLVDAAGETVLRTLGAAEMVAAEPRGHVDHVDGTGLRGWVVDPATWRIGAAPRLTVGALTVDLPLNELRPDLGAAAPGEAMLGFSYGWPTVVAWLRGLDPAFALPRGETALAVESSGVELARLRYSHDPQVRGRIERVRDGALAGWAVDGARAHEAVPLDLMVDDVRYLSGRAARERDDLRKKGIALRGGGFRLALPPRSPADAAPPALTVRGGLTDEAIDGGPVVLEEVGVRRRERTTLLQMLPPPTAPGVSVIVPIFRAADDLARCLDALRRHTSFPARLILVDDASNDPDVDALLAEAAEWPNVTVVVHAANRGFTGTVNHGIALAERDDVVLLNSDAVVTPGWLEGLRVAAWSEPGVATATPLSDNAGAFSVPEHGTPNRMPDWFDHDDSGRLVRQASLGLMPAMPTGNGFCLYIRRDCLDAIGAFDEAAFPRGYGEENDFCMRAWRQGLVNLIDDRTFVHHRRNASFGAEKTRNYAGGRAVVDERYPEYRQLTGLYRDDPDMLAIRWRVRRAVEAARAGGAMPRPRTLFVISTTSGGTPQTNADLMAALADRYEPWVLRSDSRVLELSRWTSAGPEVVETHALERPIYGSVHRSSEYDARVADLLLRYGFELVHIRHIAWHGLALPSICRRLGLPVVLSFHDFYTVCPTTKLLDESLRYCGGQCTPGEGHCVPELWPTGAIPPLKHRFVHRWREMMAPAIAACDAFVTTSPGARETMVRNFPDLATRDFRVIPHARDFAAMESLAATPSSAEPFRILVPGNISIAKGAELIAAIAALDSAQQIEFHILGDPGRIPAGPNVVLHGRYERAGFLDAVRRIRPHAGAILSIWPETYSHTLTEMWAAGLPVLALDTGAVGERIADHGGGWLFDPASTPAMLMEALMAIRHDRRGMRERIERVIDWQSGTGRTYDTGAMAASYDRLYRTLRRRRLAFAEAEGETPVVLSLAGTEDGGSPLASLAQRTRNHVGRDVIYRAVPPHFSWEDATLAGADGVLVALSALRQFQVPALLKRVREEAVPLIVDMGASAAGDWPGVYADLLAAARLVLCHNGESAGAARAQGWRTEQVLPRIDGARWRGEGPVHRARGGGPARVLVIAGDTAEAERARAVVEPLATAGRCQVALAGTAEDAQGWAEPVAVPPRGDIPGLRAMLGERDMIVIADADRDSAAAWRLVARVLGVASVDLVEDAGAMTTLAALCSDPLALDRAALAAWRSVAPEDMAVARRDSLDALIVAAIASVPDHRVAADVDLAAVF